MSTQVHETVENVERTLAKNKAAKVAKFCMQKYITKNMKLVM